MIKQATEGDAVGGVERVSGEPGAVFVYGTLRPGAAAFGQVAPFVRGVTPATLPGYALYDLGPFPALVPGEGVVVGEVLDLEPTVYRFALHALDRYEGYDLRRDQGLYLRRLCQPMLAGGERIAAWVYVGTPGQAARGRHIPHGDWLRWQEQGL